MSRKTLKVFETPSSSTEIILSHLRKSRERRKSRYGSDIKKGEPIDESESPIQFLVRNMVNLKVFFLKFLCNGRDYEDMSEEYDINLHHRC